MLRTIASTTISCVRCRFRHRVKLVSAGEDEDGDEVESLQPSMCPKCKAPHPAELIAIIGAIAPIGDKDD